MATSDIQLFKKYVHEASEALGLRDWNIQVDASKRGQVPEDVRCRVFMNFAQRSARIIFNGHHKADPDSACDQTLRQYAWHEVLHVAINPLVMMTLERKKWGDVGIDAEEHALIRRIMHLRSI